MADNMEISGESSASSSTNTTATTVPTITDEQFLAEDLVEYDPSLPTITLVSNNKDRITVPKDIMMASEVLKDCILSCCDENGNVMGDIPLENVDTETLKYIIKYCRHYNGNPPDPETTKYDDIEGWELKYITMRWPKLFELSLAANFMNVNSLVHLCAKRIAACIKGKTYEEIKDWMEITENFTEEQLLAVREDPAWISDPNFAI